MAIQGFISIALDDATLKKIAGFSGLRSELTDAISLALDEGAQIVAQTAEDNTWIAFQNPTGNLVDHITYGPAGVLKSEVVVDVPYAKRLEFGFHGADSLGRVYNNAPEPYAEPALLESTNEILLIVRNSIYDLFDQIATLS